jgi:polygalacturonase
MLLEVEGILPTNVISGLCIENLTWTPEVTIRNSRFERTNTRGLLLTTRRKILVENNTFFRTGMHAILIADDASGWFESGAVQDVTIRNNTFTECGYNSAPGNFVIAIAPENHQQVPGYFVHSNIRIENNIFFVCDYPVLTARSIDNLTFTGNTVKWTTLMKSGEKRAGFDLTDCKNVTVKNNLFELPQMPIISAKGMKKKDLTADSKSTTINIE